MRSRSCVNWRAADRHATMCGQAGGSEQGGGRARRRRPTAGVCRAAHATGWLASALLSGHRYGAWAACRRRAGEVQGAAAKALSRSLRRFFRRDQQGHACCVRGAAASGLWGGSAWGERSTSLYFGPRQPLFPHSGHAKRAGMRAPSLTSRSRPPAASGPAHTPASLHLPGCSGLQTNVEAVMHAPAPPLLSAEWTGGAPLPARRRRRRL